MEASRKSSNGKYTRQISVMATVSQKKVTPAFFSETWLIKLTYTHGEITLFSTIKEGLDAV